MLNPTTLRNIVAVRWPLLFIMAVFIILKIPHLFANFFWDESWPYASGVYTMYANGPSLKPGAIDGELSRGHPLLFHFLGALWMKIFGTTKLAIHSYALAISLLLLISVYEAGVRLFSKQVATTALLLVAFQLTFFVQAAFVLPEVLVALCGFLSVYFYVTNKYWLTTLMLTMLFFTKESGLVLGAVLGIDAFISLFHKAETLKSRVLKIVSVSVPIVLIGLFFVTQKVINGWYVLPLYTEGLEHSWQAYYEKMREGAKFVFRNDFRRYFFLLLVILSLVIALKQKRILSALPVMAGLTVFLMASDSFHFIASSYIVVILFLISILVFFIKAADITGCRNGIQRKFLALSGIFCVLFFMFSAYNMFYIFRYLLIALVPVLFVSALLYEYYSKNLLRKFSIIFLLPVVVIQAYAFKNTPGIGDSQLGAFDGIYIHEQVVDFLVKNKLHDKSIGVGANMQRIHLVDPYSGYLNSPDTFTNVQWDITPETQIVIFDNLEPDNRHKFVCKDSNYKLIFRTTKGEGWAEIYKHEENVE